MRLKKIPAIRNSKCVACAKSKGQSCCEWPFLKDEKLPGNAPSMTFHDVARIEKSTGMRAEEFCVVRESCDEVMDEIKGDFISRLFLGRRTIQLRNTPNGCPFLTVNGCGIYEARPKICRIYPFWFSIDREGRIRITLGADTPEEANCLINQWHSDGRIAKALSELNETPATMRKTIREFIKEVEVFEKYKSELGKKSVSEIIWMIGETLGKG